MTKLLDSSYRMQVLSTFNPNTLAKEKLDAEMSQYARSIVDVHLAGQDKAFSKDPKAGYGLSPITFICAVKHNGTIPKLLLEMQQVNHFLKSNDVNSAAEVMKCILVLWATNDKDICSFDVEKIESELKKAESKAIKQKACDDCNQPTSNS